MTDYNHNLILKYQNSLLSSLGMKYDETLNKHLYHHAKKNEDVEPVTEEKALNDFLAFLKKFMRDDDKKYMIFMHSKDTYVDLLLTKIHVYNLTWEFAEFVEGFCDFTTFLSQLKLDVICKSAKFQDIIDVYKQVGSSSFILEFKFSLFHVNILFIFG